MKYTLEEAIKYSKDGNIDKWVQMFLRTKYNDFANPNVALADGLLLEDRFYYGPVIFSLDDITTKRVESDLEGNELEWYNKVVDRMSNDFDETNFPPLILEFKDNKFYLTDGNHRYSALKKLGVDKYYSIIWGNVKLEKEVSKKLKM